MAAATSAVPKTLPDLSRTTSRSPILAIGIDQGGVGPGDLLDLLGETP